MDTVTGIALGGLVVAAGLCIVRLVRPGTVTERIVALDTLLAVIVTGIAVQAARSGEGTYLDLLVVASLLGFVSTVTVARYIEHRGSS